MSRQAISRWEVGSAIPDAVNVLQLSKLFGVTADYLLNDDYESDRDVPVVKQTKAETYEAWKKETKKLFSLGISAFGLFGNFVIYLISRFIKVMVPFIYYDENGEKWYKWTADYTGYSYYYFIQEHDLELLTVLFWGLFLAGLLYVLFNSRFLKKVTAKLKKRSS